MFRPHFVISLCIVLAFGQAPAWLHVGQCGSHARVAVDNSGLVHAPADASSFGWMHIGDLISDVLAQSHAHCPHGCVHGDGKALTESDQSAALCDDAHSDGVVIAFTGCCHSHGSGSVPHESDHCVVCQSLAAPTGFHSPELPLPSTTLVAIGDLPGKSSACPIDVRCLPPSRGPPRALVLASV